MGNNGLKLLAMGAGLLLSVLAGWTAVMAEVRTIVKEESPYVRDQRLILGNLEDIKRDVRKLLDWTEPRTGVNSR